jgi:hypothetical protein
MQMTPFDFSTQVSNGQPLPLHETEFSFWVPGTSTASVDKRGIHCGNVALMQITPAVNAVELTVINGADRVIITASDASGGNVRSQNVASMPQPQTVRFDFGGIRLITFDAPGNELYLMSIR